MSSEPEVKSSGFFHLWNNHILNATKEPDGTSPSSARLLAALIILVVLLIQIVITTILVVKLVTLNPALPNATALATAYIGLLRVELLFGVLFDIATALSFYGINVWKYVSSLANPLAGLAGGLSGEALKKLVSSAQKLPSAEEPKEPEEPKEGEEVKDPAADPAKP